MFGQISPNLIFRGDKFYHEENFQIEWEIVHFIGKNMYFEGKCVELSLKIVHLIWIKNEWTILSEEKITNEVWISS